MDKILEKLPDFPHIPLPLLTRRAKWSLFGVSFGIGLVLFLATLLKRRRRGRGGASNTGIPGVGRAKGSKPGNLTNVISSNGELPYKTRSTSPMSSSRASLRGQRKTVSRSPSLASVSRSSSLTTLTSTQADHRDMNAMNICELGLETLQQAVNMWEDALAKLAYVDVEDNGHLAIPDSETSTLQHQIEYLLDMAYRMQDDYERRCIHHADHLAINSAICAITEMDRIYGKHDSIDAESMSDQDSFASARDLADLSDLDTHRELFKHFALYEAGLMELKHGTIPFRTLRPHMADCLSETEFLAKLHCIRLAMELLFKEERNMEWFVEAGREILAALLVKAERSPDEFCTAYDEIIDYVRNRDNWQEMETELRGRGVKVFTFYDVVLDFILMDAFDDLDNPPVSVTAVVQNRWLSNGFKETALSTACWSVLKAKRRLLKCPNGFISHFYAISEHISPVLAWGFLGPEGHMKRLCMFFKELITSFIRDIFSFERSRYTSVEALAEDILEVAREKRLSAAERLSS